MRSRKKGTGFASALVLSLSILLTVALFAAASVYFLKKTSDASAFAVGESGIFIPQRMYPAAELAKDAGTEVVDYMLPGKLSFICAGDNLIHTDVYGAAKRYGEKSDDGREYDFMPMFEGIKDFISGYDFAFLNQEVPIAGKELGFSGYPCFNSPDELGDAVVETGFNVINIATNHMLDKRNIGLKNAVEYWRAKPVMLVGDYLSRQEYDTIEYYENDGIKIALLAYTYETNGIRLQNNGDDYVVPYIDREDIKKKTAVAKQNADLVFVSIHWGFENTPDPSAEQYELARMMADIGVDVVIGHHSHSVQPTEWLDRPDGKKTLVVYSLGNLLSGMQKPINIIGGMLSFDVEYLGDGEQAQVTNAKVIPTVCHFYGSPRNYKVYLFTDYTRELAAKHQLAGRVNFDEMKAFITDTVDASFLTEEFLAWDGQ